MLPVPYHPAPVPCHPAPNPGIQPAQIPCPPPAPNPCNQSFNPTITIDCKELQSCPRFTSKRERCVKTKCGVAKVTDTYSTNFVFDEKCNLFVHTKKIREGIESIELRQPYISLCISILNSPKTIKRIKHSLEKKLDTTICMYVSCDGRLLARSNDSFLIIDVQSKGYMARPLGKEEVSSLAAIGLCGVEFKHE